MSLRPYTWQQAVLKSSLPSTTKLVLLAVGHHVTAAGEAACVSTVQLASETSLSERAVISHLKSVESAWLVTRRHGYGDKRWARNEYLPRLPGDPSLDVKGTERPSVPAAESSSDGTERGSAPSVPEGTERGDKKALNVVHPDNGFDLKLYPPKPPTNSELLGSPQGDLEAWFRDEFWKRFPNRKARAAAWRAAKRLRPDAELRRAIIAGLVRWLRERDALASRGAFVPALPMPATWLNGRRWEDESDPLAVPRGTEAVIDYRCSTCSAPGVVSVGKRWYCRAHDPMKLPQQGGQRAVSA